MPDLIEFNVGGKNFTTTYETIGFDKKCAFYTWYIERKGSAHLTKDRKGKFFIDRDPDSFAIILNYLRLQCAKQLWEVCLPKDPDRLALLTQEADYFRLPKLRDQAIALLHKCTTAENNEAGGNGYVNEVSIQNGGKNGKKNLLMNSNGKNEIGGHGHLEGNFDKIEVKENGDEEKHNDDGQEY